jgi:hypothetical protein
MGYRLQRALMSKQKQWTQRLFDFGHLTDLDLMTAKPLNSPQQPLKVVVSG